MQKWAPWAMTPSRNAWPWTRLPMSRPCMSVNGDDDRVDPAVADHALELREARVLSRGGVVAVVAHRLSSA